MGVSINFAPGAATPPHRHGGADVCGYVISGRVFNKMNDDPMTTKETGDSWYEAPGCRHRISSNASETEPAALFAAMVLDTEALERDGMNAIIQIDPEWEYLLRDKS